MREWVARRGIPLLEAARDLPSTEGTAGEPFDYLFSVVNMGLLAPEVLALPRRMAINYHDGPLPRYAGAHATSWAILRGERAHGVTWHEMTALVDAGRCAVIDWSLPAEQTSALARALDFGPAPQPPGHSQGRPRRRRPAGPAG